MLRGRMLGIVTMVMTIVMCKYFMVHLMASNRSLPFFCSGLFAVSAWAIFLGIVRYQIEYYEAEWAFSWCFGLYTVGWAFACFLAPVALFIKDDE
jgi:hypothetical protein